MNWKEYPKITPPKNINLLITVSNPRNPDGREVLMSQYVAQNLSKNQKFGFFQEDHLTIHAWCEMPAPYTKSASENLLKLKNLIRS